MMDRPIAFESWQSSIKAVKARRSKERIGVRVASFEMARNVSYSLEFNQQRADVIAWANRVGQHRFPPQPDVIDVRRLIESTPVEAEFEGFRPSHLALRPLPEQLPTELYRAPAWRRAPGEQDDSGEPTTIFAPDTRYVFADTSFPWCTCGRVDTPGGSGSGVLIGPRHIMTASHVINWGPNNTAGWVKFTPLLFDTSEPFGSAFATRIYWWQQVNAADQIQSNEAAFDYVVCVLDQRLGDITGWMGSRGYSTDWDGGAFWAHVGYPSDLGSGSRPVFHGNGVMDNTVTESSGGRDSFRIMHQNDVIPGQSGGPYFGWWEDEPWPRVIASQSAENWGTAGGPNAAGGGNPLPELINHARTVEP
jgi:V8-like Glu-specific endopeptidase